MKKKQIERSGHSRSQRKASPSRHGSDLCPRDRVLYSNLNCFNSDAKAAFGNVLHFFLDSLIEIFVSKILGSSFF